TPATKAYSTAKSAAMVGPACALSSTTGGEMVGDWTPRVRMGSEGREDEAARPWRISESLWLGLRTRFAAGGWSSVESEAGENSTGSGRGGGGGGEGGGAEFA